ncbi:MAG: hypothetical protein ACYTFT_03385 [Planctomycetota bacterium]|jgi:hypothetical protein
MTYTRPAHIVSTVATLTPAATLQRGGYTAREVADSGLVWSEVLILAGAEAEGMGILCAIEGADVAPFVLATGRGRRKAIERMAAAYATVIPGLVYRAPASRRRASVDSKGFKGGRVRAVGDLRNATLEAQGRAWPRGSGSRKPTPSNSYTTAMYAAPVGAPVTPSRAPALNGRI